MRRAKRIELDGDGPLSRINQFTTALSMDSFRAQTLEGKQDQGGNELSGAEEMKDLVKRKGE